MRRRSRPEGELAEIAPRSSGAVGDADRGPVDDLVEVLGEAGADEVVAAPGRHALGDARRQHLAVGSRAGCAAGCSTTPCPRCRRCGRRCRTAACTAWWKPVARRTPSAGRRRGSAPTGRRRSERGRTGTRVVRRRPSSAPGHGEGEAEVAAEVAGQPPVPPDALPVPRAPRVVAQPERRRSSSKRSSPTVTAPVTAMCCSVWPLANDFSGSTLGRRLALLPLGLTAPRPGDRPVGRGRSCTARAGCRRTPAAGRPCPAARPAAAPCRRT